MGKKVIIISFTFPPRPGIGGRRWAKFAKYMHRDGCDVLVFTTKNDFDETSPWTDDIREYRNCVTQVKSGYPAILRRTPVTLLDKIWYRFALRWIKWKVKGNYYDHSARWMPHLMPKLERAILEGYDNIIATGGPFAYLGELVRLKEKHAHVRLVIDFRDPWTTNRTSFGYDEISAGRYQYEQERERMTIALCDVVTTVAVPMTEYFRSLDSTAKNKFRTIPNGFDRDDFNSCKSRKADDDLRFVFTGTFYNKALPLLERLVDVLGEIEMENPQVFQSMTFDFYGSMPEKGIDLCNRSRALKYHGAVNLNETHKLICNGDVAMLFLTDDITYSFSTKFCEYIAQKKPVCVFSVGGFTGTYVAENDIGYNATPTEIKRTLLHIHEQKRLGELKFNENFVIDDFNIERLAKNFIALLQ